MTATGVVDYAAGIFYLRGRDSKTLILHGLPVCVDATRLSASRLDIAGVVSGWDKQRVLPARVLPARVLPARVLPARVLPARVLPAVHPLGVDGKWSEAMFTVTTAGKVDYDDAYLSGAGTETLTIRTSTLPGTG